MRKVSVLVVITVILSMSVSCFIEEATAGRFGMSNRKSDVSRSQKHFIRIAPRPPGWPQMWLARDIIKSFNDNELIDESSARETEDELFDFPAHINDVIKFSGSFNERKLKGCVLEFEKKKDFETIQEHYLKLNNSNEFHTWSLMKANILVVIEGAMPAQIVKEYKEVLAGME